MELAPNLLNTITIKQVYQNTFADIVKDFDKKLLDFNPIEKAVEIKKYFQTGGLMTVTKQLLSDKVISEHWLEQHTTKNGKIKNDFKGLYVFVHDQTPIYVGISKGVIGRIIQHVKGHSHHTATLAYNIGLINLEISNGKKFAGFRKDLGFKENVTPAKNFLLEQKIAFLPVLNNEELYMFEIYCAMQLQCRLNKFETH
jgi:predicted GIY-YIG superfamily endonuclease